MSFTEVSRGAGWGTIDWRLRYGLPLLVPTAFCVIFAFSGWVTRDEPKQAVEVAPPVLLTAEESAARPAPVLSAPGARNPALRDAAVVAHEVLDPVAAGRQ